MGGVKNILLLDIDGVLLESVGYRSACVDTINDFLAQMGQPGLIVDRETVDAYEVNGITAEWDMIPLTLAFFTDAYISRTGIVPADDAFPPDCGPGMPFADAAEFRAALREQIAAYVRMLDPKLNTIDAVRLGCEKGAEGGLSSLLKLPLFRRFFMDTLDPWKCPYFAQLMDRLLGRSTFAEFYGMEAPVDCESYLATMDRLLVSDRYRELLPERSGKDFWPAVMTYRPTRLPVRDGNLKELYYVNTPEGECALRLLDWTDGRMPMIGSGSLCYIEAKYGLRRESYVKPHPFHALASAVMALCRDELTALETAHQLCEGDPERDPDPLAPWAAPNEKIRLTVFEDSVSGIEGTRNAVSVLRKWSRDAEAVLCGIRSTEGKSRRLAEVGAELYDNVNDALDEVFKKCEV